MSCPTRCSRRARCKSCRADRLRQRGKTLAKRRARRAQIIEMLGGKCAECGTTDGPFDIDHIDQQNKSFYIGRHMTIALPRLLAEVSKCRLLCLDHHRKTESYGRRRPGYYPVTGVRDPEASGPVETIEQSIEF